MQSFTTVTLSIEMVYLRNVDHYLSKNIFRTNSMSHGNYVNAPKDIANSY
jgi:CTP:phosphocholine cytidylyltransferase-like protein